jgi:hypothetical protein
MQESELGMTSRERGASSSGIWGGEADGALATLYKEGRGVKRDDSAPATAEASTSSSASGVASRCGR